MHCCIVCDFAHDRPIMLSILHCKNIRVISTLPGLAQLHLFSDLQYYIIIVITPPATEAYIIILKTYTHTVVLICMSIMLVIYYTSNQPIDSNIPLAIISNLLKRMCNIIPLQQKSILDTHSHVHTCLLLRSYKVIQ